MARTVGIGLQSFEKIRERQCFYVDKTKFIKEWWENLDDVTLITRPRRFGKTLTMSMTEQFFSIRYAGRGELFEGLSIWEDEKYRKLQGTYPVISLSFANVKENGYEKVRYRICQILRDLYVQNYFLLDGDLLTPGEKDYFNRISETMNEEDATMSLHYLSSFLSRYYNKKVIILLDEYDTPMQEAYINGLWDESASFTRSMFNAAFKTNPHLERAIMTGITRDSRESIFSDLNNLEVVTAICEKTIEKIGRGIQDACAEKVAKERSYEKETANIYSTDRLNEILISFSEGYYQQATAIENTCIENVKNYYDDIIQLLEQASDTTKIGSNLKRLKREKSRIGNHIHGAIKDQLAKKMSLDNSECLQNLKMDAGEEKRKAITKFSQRIINEALDLEENNQERHCIEPLFVLNAIEKIGQILA